MNIYEVQNCLREAKKSNISLADIAKAIGTSRGYVSKIAAENKELNKQKMDKIEQYFAVDFKQIALQNDDDCMVIEHIGIKPSCGCGTMVFEEPEIRPIKLGNDVISHYMRCSHPLNLKAFTASGDSMSPLIEDGDLLLVDTGRTELSNSGVYVFSLNNEWRVKRFNLKIDGRLEIISDNPKYEKELLEPDCGLELYVKGRVIKNLSRGL